MDKADAIYETILLALASGDGQKVLLSLGEPCVYRIFELCRATNREACHHLEFLRFSELENGVLLPRSIRRTTSFPIWQSISPTVCPPRTL